MKKIILLFVVALFINKSNAQDTTWVQTFNFSDIIKRKGTYNFPTTGVSYQKVLMYYTLKCDPNTIQDNYNCGEWDYLSNTVIYDSLGVKDSVLTQHPNYIIGNTTPPIYAYRTTPTWTKFKYYQKFLVIDVNNSEATFNNGTGTLPLQHTFNSSFSNGKAQYLWLANELTTAGLTSGLITGIELPIGTNGDEIKNLTIKIRNSSRTTLDSLNYEKVALTTVYRKHTTLTGNTNNRINFTTPFNWNGTSNLVVEFTFDNTVGGNPNFVLGSTTTFNSGIYAASSDYALEMGNQRFLTIPNAQNVFSNLTNEISVSFWAWGDPAKLPANNTYAFEATDNAGTRILNVHLPWSDGKIYFDAGHIDNGVWFDTDRISKTAVANDYKNQWNYWVFTKNAVTGSMKAYLNGTLYMSGTKKWSSLAGIKNFKIGNGLNETQHFYHGKIKNFQVWKKELSAAEITAWMYKDVTPSHPQYSHLLLNLPFSEGAGITTDDASPNNFDPQMVGYPQWKQIKGAELFKNIRTTKERPNITWVKGDYTTHLDSTLVLDSIQNAPVSVAEYNHPTDPTQLTSTTNVWPSGYTYVYNDLGVKIDSVLIAPTGSYTAAYRNYYKKFDKVEQYEIGRFITPYGIGLSLGANGFTWLYDVTDYRNLLDGNVTISAGNQQELIDLKFAFITGTPPANHLKTTKIANYADYTYQSLVDDVNIPDQQLQILPNTGYAKIKARITGHGHEGIENSSTGQIHCCEWAYKDHYLDINGVRRFTWDPSTHNDCTINPVFPQGGNWAMQRGSGWCPSAPVGENNLNVTPYILAGNANNFNYQIEDIPTDNPGQGTGNFLVSLHLFEFGAPNFTNDVAMEEMITPSTMQIHQRINPICHSPKIKIINKGSATLTKCTINYGVDGGTSKSYTWNGSLKFMESAIVELPYTYYDWYNGSSTYDFFAETTLPNDVTDQQASNNKIITTFTPAPAYPSKVIVKLKNNALANDVSYTIKAEDGTVVFSKSNMAINQTFNDTIELVDGCYKFELTTVEGLGLKYPLISQVGNGTCSLGKLTGTTFTALKTFNPDFGRNAIQYFTVGLPTAPIDLSANENNKIPEFISAYPNPNTGNFEIDYKGNTSEEVTIMATDMLGKIVYTKTVKYGEGILSHAIDLSEQPNGVYIVKVSDKNNNAQFTKIIKQ